MKRADRWFSKYMRLSYADHAGRVRCCTCGRVKQWQQVDWGHFMSREAQSTRYHEKNGGPQCPHCNRFKQGKQYEMAKWIDKTHGPMTADKMMMLSKMACHRKAYDFDYIAEEYKNKFQCLQK